MKDFEDLSYANQKRLYNKGDPRVPEGWKPKPVGRPKGFKMSEASKRRMVNSRGDSARRVARAINTLLLVYGTPEAIAEAVLGRKV